MNYKPLHPDAIQAAHKRIGQYIHHTPLLQSGLLNNWLGHEVIFKAENMQKTGAFKIRGALNTLLSLKEIGEMPDEVVTFSSGNHAQAVAMAASKFGVKVTVFMPESASEIKKQATESHGARVITTKTREQAESEAAQMAKQGAYLIHPFDNDFVIAGQGTVCYEALKDNSNISAIFATCGGGGLLSGTYLASKLLAPQAVVIAGEPAIANDAAKSFHAGVIKSLDASPKTIADGARTLAVSQRTFHYLKQLNGFFEVSEEEIIYWSQWLSHLLKVLVEPTSAVAMAAAFKWLQTQDKKQQVLVILSGGNISSEIHSIMWQHDYLKLLPHFST